MYVKNFRHWLQTMREWHRANVSSNVSPPTKRIVVPQVYKLFSLKQREVSEGGYINYYFICLFVCLSVFGYKTRKRLLVSACGWQELDMACTNLVLYVRFENVFIISDFNECLNAKLSCGNLSEYPRSYWFWLTAKPR